MLCWGSRVACVVWFHKQSFWIFNSRISHYDVWAQKRPEQCDPFPWRAACNDGGDGGLVRCWFHLGCSAIIQERRRGGAAAPVLERHHFIPPIPLRHHWNIIRCLLTFKSCSAAVISIGPAAISVKCPLATLLLHMEDFLSPSVVSLLHFAPSLHLTFYPPCPLKPGCNEGWEPLALRKWATTGDAVGQKTGWKTLTPLDSDMFVLHCVPLEKKKKCFNTHLVQLFGFPAAVILKCLSAWVTFKNSVFIKQDANTQCNVHSV